VDAEFGVGMPEIGLPADGGFVRTSGAGATGRVAIGKFFSSARLDGSAAAGIGRREAKAECGTVVTASGS
jgi:hypothetical protein